MTRFLLVRWVLSVRWGLTAALALATPALAAVPDGAPLYFQGKVDAAEAAFKATLDAPDATTRQKSRAANGLARIAWLVDGDVGEALAALDRAPSPDPDACPVLVLRLRILREAGRAGEALAASTAHAGACKEVSAKVRLATETAHDALAANDLDRARAELSRIDAGHAVAPDVQTLTLDLALRRGDAPGALAAWRGFFWLTGGAMRPQGMDADNAAVPRLFTTGMRPRASTSSRIALERLLIRGGFYPEARDFDRAHRVGQAAGKRPAYRPIATYFALRATIDPQTLAFNRLAARGHGDGAAYIKATEADLLKAAQALEPGAKAYAEPLRRAFGYFGTIGLTGGYPSLHAGHVVQDERMAVAQAGRKGEVRFIAIDNLVSNGFQSWLWDGFASTGGWATNDAIVQVRAAYTPSTLQALDAVVDADTPSALAKQAELEAQDARLAAAPGVVFLPGEAARMMLQARRQVATAARAEAARTGEPFAQVFVHRDWDAVLQHSIRIHEGRHVLDKQEYLAPHDLDGPELEYRAKLSELEYADYPMLALANIFAANMGDTSPHGQANLKVIRGLVEWMGAHQGEITGFDPARPALLQMDRVSDSQLRAYAHSVDPEEHR